MNWDKPTYGELGDALCKIETKEQAADFWQAYVTYLNRPDANLLGDTVEEVAASNIGYLMGYYGPEERQRVYALFAAFNVAHPIFGKSELTASEAFDAGKASAAAR